MDINNPYKRTFITKREEYQEKLKRRNNSQDWIFGNIFGKPGGGAPLRDNRGNIISHLKTINNNNIFKYDPNYFSKGENDISSINNNFSNNNINIINTVPQTNSQNNSFTQRNEYTPSLDIGSNNLNNNFNLFNQSEILNQRNMPIRYIIPIQNIFPLNQLYPSQINNQVQNYIRNIPTTPAIKSNSPNLNLSINYPNNSKNIINENIISKNKEDINNDKSRDISNINNNDEYNKLLISNDNDLNNKLQKEQKLEEWKNDLKKQMEEQRRRKEEEKIKMLEEDKKEEMKYKEYLEYKNRQAEENKKNKNKWKKNMSQFNQSSQKNNIELEKTNNNDLDQTQPSMNYSQKMDYEEEPYTQDNPLNNYNITPEMISKQENFKNYIDNQYNSLEEQLNKNIQKEVEIMASKLTKKYEPFSNEENPNLYKFTKYNDITAERNSKKMEKLQDIREQRDLLEFIIGKDNNNISSSFMHQNYDINKYNISRKMPSYFGKNIVPYENKNKQLKTYSRFSYIDNKESKAEEIEDENSYSNSEIDYGKNKERAYNNKIYSNNNYNKKFGKNKDDIMNSQSLEFSQSLDNKSSFIPLNKNNFDNNKEKENININKNDFEIKYQPKPNINLDRIEENIIKNLDEIDKLNKNVILYDKNENKINEDNQNLQANEINGEENNVEKKEDNQQISQRKEREEELNSNNDKMQLESSEKLFEKLSDNIPNITNKENNSKNSLEIKSNENNVSENEKISNENENNKEKSQDQDKNKDPDLVSNEESYEESDENDRESN